MSNTDDGEDYLPQDRRNSLSAERRSTVLAGLARYIERRQRRQRRLTTLGVGAIVVGSLGAAAWVVLAPPEVLEQYAWCYSGASLDSSVLEVRLGLSGSEIPEGSAVDRALSACADFWRIGAITPAGEPRRTASGSSNYPIPPLAACLRSDQTITVFPHDAELEVVKLCWSLNLVPARGDN